VHIWVRSDVKGPSSGISTASAEERAEAEPRDLSVWVEDLRETAAAELRADRMDTRPGILVIAFRRLRLLGGLSHRSLASRCGLFTRLCHM